VVGSTLTKHGSLDVMLNCSVTSCVPLFAREVY
jgi:hypothetical protein